MAEQAQRRAPLGQPQETPKDDSQQFEELRHLIVAPEQEGIAEISHRLDNLERRAEDVSSVVVEAIELRRQQDTDGALAAALGPTIEDTLRDSVRKHPHILADALFPVMGPAIRKSITETLRSMLESFNEALEHSLSIQGIQWRIEALRTGKPYAEVVILHSLIYRVEEVFLIHKETGLVLNHVTEPTISAKDADMVAGMLSAIKQFFQDGLRARQDEPLDNVGAGEFRLWIEDSPHAVIAAAVRGHAPETFRLRMQEALEGIEEHFSLAFENFKNDAGPFRSAEERLMPLFQKQQRDPEKPKSRKKLRALAGVSVLVLLGLVGWMIYITLEVRKWTTFANGLKDHSGIVVTSYTKENGKYQFQGFRDPLAEDPTLLAAQAGFSAKDAEFHLKPFYSMEDAIVLKRAKIILAPPAGVKLSMKDGKLTAEGNASPQWIARLQDRGGWIAGVTDVDTSHLQNGAAAALERLKATIEGIIFVFPLGRADLEPGQDALLAHTQVDFGNLLAEAARANASVHIEVIGHTDSTGIETANLPLSKQRADVVTSLLIHAGVKAAAFQSRGVGTSQPLRSEDTEEGRHFNRSVTFHVDIAPASPAN
jgi:outer membrane protein OmpA-like peptidoglycan-associated protein